MRVLHALGVVPLDGRRQVAMTANAISLFFDVYVKGAPASELNRLRDYPELEISP